MPSLSFKLRSVITKSNFVVILTAATLAIYFGIRIAFIHPYGRAVEADIVFNTFVMVFIPACLSFASMLLNKPLLIYIAFLLALPGGLYLAGTPLFSSYRFVVALYMISIILTSIRLIYDTDKIND